MLFIFRAYCCNTKWEYQWSRFTKWAQLVEAVRCKGNSKCVWKYIGHSNAYMHHAEYTIYLLNILIENLHRLYSVSTMILGTSDTALWCYFRNKKYALVSLVRAWASHSRIFECMLLFQNLLFNFYCLMILWQTNISCDSFKGCNKSHSLTVFMVCVTHLPFVVNNINCHFADTALAVKCTHVTQSNYRKQMS